MVDSPKKTHETKKSDIDEQLLIFFDLEICKSSKRMAC